eukprot:COSAG01_NODE_579_length_15238_cov_10.570183_11_plen_260_part_01
MDPVAVLTKIKDAQPLTMEDIAVLHQIVGSAQLDTAALLASATPALALQAVEAEGQSEGTALGDFATMKVIQQVEEWIEEDDEGPGRGYSEWDRAPNRLFIPQDRVSEFYSHPERFQAQFTLRPDEFDVQFLRIQAALIVTRPHCKIDPRNRFGMALHFCKTKMSMERVGQWFGCGKSLAAEIIQETMKILSVDPGLTSEIAWPGVVGGPPKADFDDDVVRVAMVWPNLAGLGVVGDVKKKLGNLRGNTFDRDMHKIDYD